MSPAPDGRPLREPPPEASEPHWRFTVLLAAPHRLTFFAGATMLAAASIWWLIALAAGVMASGSVPWALAPGGAHALIMSFSFMPMFFAGFICTAAPRWLKLPPVDARTLVPIVVAWLGGWLLFVVGAHLALPVTAIGLAFVAAAWSALCGRSFRMLAASAAADRTHLRVIAGACAVGALELWFAAAAIALGESAALHWLAPATLWWFLAPVFAAAVHRMVPFFGTVASPLNERHENWLLWTWLAFMLAQPPFAWALEREAVVTPLVFVVDTVAALAVFWLALRWRTRHRLGSHLLQMLFAGFAWLGVAFALQAANAALAWSGGAAFDLQRASMHALAMGFFGSTMLAMVSRITCGQSGRMLSAERPVWLLFLGLQAATLLRLASVLLPQTPLPLLGAALAWAIVMVAWSVRYIGWYGRPRADGRPG